MPETAKRLNLLTESVVRKMTWMAQRYNAINRLQEFPATNPPQEVLGAARLAMDRPYPQDPITWRATNFLQALIKKQSHFMSLDLNGDTHIVVTCDGTEAMMVAMMTVCNPGDKVVVFFPFHENYGADMLLIETGQRLSRLGENG